MYSELLFFFLQERPLLILTRSLEDNTKMHINWCDIVECIFLRQYKSVWWAVVSTVLKFRVLLKAGNFLLPEQLTDS